MTELYWLWLPLAASAALSLSLVPLGYGVLARGVVFADLAIAQWAALGSLVAASLLPLPSTTWSPAISMLFALIAAGAVHVILRRFKDVREAMIGVLYVVGASLATLVVSRDVHGARALHQTLAGDLLWTTHQDLYPLFGIAGLILLLQWLGSPRVNSLLFLPLFACAVTLGVAVAGIYVVFATLIVAPLCLGKLASVRPLGAVACCFLGQAIGLVASAQLDSPAGPSVVVGIVLASVGVQLLVWKFLGFKTAARQTENVR